MHEAALAMAKAKAAEILAQKQKLKQQLDVEFIGTTANESYVKGCSQRRKHTGSHIPDQENNEMFPVQFNF